MKREYFILLVIIELFVISFLIDKMFGQGIVKNNLFRFSPVLIIFTFVAGQYSMRFPKAF
jgi:hypothetical protein